MRISQYVNELTDKNLFHLTEALQLCPNLVPAFQQKAFSHSDVQEDKEELRQQTTQKQRFKKAMQLFAQQQIDSKATFSFTPFDIHLNNPLHSPATSDPVLNESMRQEMRETLITLLNRVQAQVLRALHAPKDSRIPILPISLIQIDATTHPSAFLVLEKKTHSYKGSSGKNCTKKNNKRLRIPSNKKSRAKKQKRHLNDHQDHLDQDDHQEGHDLNGKKAPGNESFSFTRQFILQQIQETIEHEIKIYKQRLELSSGRTSVDRRKDHSSIKREFYKWYFDQVTIFMDGYLFPHKDLRNQFEKYTSSSPITIPAPLFSEEDIQELSTLLTSYVTNISLSQTKQTKIRNLIIHLGILFRSFLNLTSCIESECNFNMAKTHWIQSLNEPPCNTLGRSARDTIEKTLLQYKFRS